MINDLLRMALDPKTLAAVGGFTAYRTIGGGKAGWQKYAYALGGALAGYGLGTLAAKVLPVAKKEEPTTTASKGTTLSTTKQLTGRKTVIDADFVDLGPVKAEDVVSATDADDAAILESLGSFDVGDDVEDVEV